MAQTERILNDIARRLREVIAVVKANACPDYEAAYAVASFFRDYENTNAVVKSAIEAVNRNNLEFKADAEAFIAVADTFCKVAVGEWSHVDYQKLYADHMQPWNTAVDKAQKISVALWREYSQLSNRLDYVMLDTPEYEKLDRDCEVAKRKADEAAEVTKARFKEREDAGRQTFCVHAFKWSYLVMLVGRLREIAGEIVESFNDEGDGEG